MISPTASRRSLAFLSLAWLLAIPTGAAAQSLTFTFDNAQVAYLGGDAYFSFDVDVAASHAGTAFGPLLVLIDYDTEAFGTAVHGEGGASARPGALIGARGKYALLVRDHGESRLAVTVYFSPYGRRPGAAVGTTPETLFRVTMRMADDDRPPGLRFAEALMQGQQFQDDLTTAYAPVVANDTEDGQGAADVDGDGIDDDVDDCPGTIIPEPISAAVLKPNRYALVDADWTFDVGVRDRRDASGRTYTTTDTRGCSCTQIALELRAGNGHRKHGCPAGVMEAWIAMRGPRKAGSAGDEALPATFELAPNYPNPFNPRTTIRYGAPEAGPVRLAVYDVLGRAVSVLVDGAVEAGRYEAHFEARSLPSGLYLYRLETPAGTIERTMLLLK